MREDTHQDAADSFIGDACGEPARFPQELTLSSGDPTYLRDARKAVREELRISSRWVRLTCQKVHVFSESDRGVIFAIYVGSGLEFDWTWEGALAFRPHALEENDAIDLADFEESPVEEASQWSGEILEVDPQQGCLFISLTSSDHPPTVGTFLVRPFDFLGTLDDIYHEERFRSLSEVLSQRLSAATGSQSPQVRHTAAGGLKELSPWWQYSWSMLWGPPGTGKTYTIGRQVAAALADPTERILVVSTTNRATDAVALSIGTATVELADSHVEELGLVRIGRGAAVDRFQSHGLDSMLVGTETEKLREIELLSRQLPLVDSWEEKAFLRKKIQELRSSVGDHGRVIFTHRDFRVVITTSFKALQFLHQETVRSLLERNEAPFTTIVIDEAGLISRAATAALSLLAARRVVLVGDSKQLAPISRVRRVLTTVQQAWLASSGVSHLHHMTNVSPAVHVLTEQRRMRPEICQVVSAYQYGSILTTAPEVNSRPCPLPPCLSQQPRAIWYVIDEENKNLASIRAERGPGNRSWIRKGSLAVLEKILQASEMRTCHGLFISPYVAQAQMFGQWFAENRLESWEASTVHRQQGSEADVVIFDTVNAGSHQWPHDEWKRLVNVAISRAREAVIVIASRSEMEEPYLSPLGQLLTPQVLVKKRGGVQWQSASQLTPPDADEPCEGDDTLGGQFALRRKMKPILSQEQQRLSQLELDGKPRLVRGVAGSGKTVVLSNWLAQTASRLQGDPQAKIWAVYANRTLHSLLSSSIEAAWKNQRNLLEFPWDQVELIHVRDLLAQLLPSVGLSMEQYKFNYDKASEDFLNQQSETTIRHSCRALFLDEAQDMGPHTLRLLLSLVEQTRPEDHNSRSAHIFFDNAQNLYGRKTPKWSEFGLDLRGRSTVMKESFRSTRPITEFAVNVLQRLAPTADLQDHKELQSLGLLTKELRDREEWLRVEYNQIDGPRPYVRQHATRDHELEVLQNDLVKLLIDEKVPPNDICLIINGNWIWERLLSDVAPRLEQFNVELSLQKSQKFERKRKTLLVTTANSFKGYEAEVVLIPCADNFIDSDDNVLASSLYVAMTRARSVLGIYSTHNANSSATLLNQTLARCGQLLKTPPAIRTLSGREELEDIIQQSSDHGLESD